MKKIKYTKVSQNDLSDIFTLIYADKPLSAKEYLLKLKEYIELLGISPEMGVDCKKKGYKRECRALFYGNYTVFYKIYQTHISIQRVINSKQNYKGK